MGEYKGMKGRRDKRFGKVSKDNDFTEEGGASFKDYKKRRDSADFSRDRRDGRRGNSRGSRDSRGGRDFRNDRRGSRGRLEMFPAVCDECKKECEVPFKPSSDKPIYCSECFEKKEGSSSSGRDRRGSRDSRGNVSSGPSQYDLDVINRKLDKIMKKLGIE